MNEITDVVIVGAGVIGASAAAHLAAAGQRVVILEACASSATGSTGRSFGGVRAQWSDPMNVALAWESIKQLRTFTDDHGIDVGYRPLGYLMLVAEDGWERQLAAVDLQRSFGVPVEVLDLEQANGIVNFVRDGLVGATWCATDGVADPHRLTDAYLELARTADAEVRFDHPVSALQVDADGQWTVTAGGQRISCQFLVNAAGGWAGELARLAGLSVPVEHSRRSMYAASAAEFDRYIPATIDTTTGVFTRTRGDHVVFSLAPTNPDSGYFETPDWDWLDVVHPVAVTRFPWLADLSVDRAACWGGTYEVTPDMQGILGADPAAPTWINACGFSGHGLMQAPVIGRLVAEQICQGDITSFDVEGLRLDRFARTTGLDLAKAVF